MKKGFKRLYGVLCSFVLAVFSLLSYVSPSFGGVFVRADSTGYQFEQTRVNDDLGEEVLKEYAEKADEYAENEEKKPALYNFTEICYSNDEAKRNSLYGLYLYIYNPARTEYETGFGASEINMAVAYNEQGEPIEYDNLYLAYCGRSTGEYAGLFYKYRVAEMDGILKSAISFDETNGRRRYDISAIQLTAKGEKANGTISVFDYGVGATYYFSGYGVGCNVDDLETSTLTVERDDLKSLQLDVQHANYRGDFYGYVCDEIQTVYFGIDNSYLNDYGGLQKISAEWYEYKTKPIFSTWDTDCVSRLDDFINFDIGNALGELPDSVYWEEVEDRTGVYKMFSKGFNVKGDELEHKWYDKYRFCINPDNFSRVTCMNWLFDLNEVANVDAGDFDISEEYITAYMEAYTENFKSEEKVLGALGQASYAESLFEASIDAERVELLEDKNATRGYIKQEIDAGDTFDLTVALPTGAWNQYWHGTNYGTKDISPIVLIEEDLSSMSASAFGVKYYIGTTHRAEALKACQEMQANGQTPVLFRFANTEYYSSMARFDTYGNGAMSAIDGYVSQETVFLGFDVIDLTFRKGGVDTVLGVASNPIDIINGIEAPKGLKKDDKLPLWAILLIILGVILVLIFIKPITSLIIWFVKWIWKIITAPFRFIIWLVKTIRGDYD